MTARPELVEFPSRDAASRFTAERLGQALDAGLADRGEATFLGSGGTSPERAYEILGMQPRDWRRVHVGLVDERWVEVGDARSNEGMLVRRLGAAAAAAQVVGMKTAAATPQEALVSVERRYREAFAGGVDAVLMGMGADGHTASWFPGARGLDAALDSESRACVAAIDATDVPGAGDCPLRMTVTASLLRRSRHVSLLVFGDEKRRVLERAGCLAEKDWPVRALLDVVSGSLDIAWAP